MYEPNEMIFKTYARTLRARGRSERTIDQYREAVADLDSFLGADLLDATKADIERYLNARMTTVKPTTVAIRFRALRAFYNWLVAEDEIERSPVRGLKEPKGRSEAPSVLSDDDLRRLLKAASGKGFTEVRDTAILRLLCEPGSPRLGELEAMKVLDVDMERDAVIVSGKTGGRIIPLGSKAALAMDRYLRVRARHPRHRETGLWLAQKGEMTASGIAQALARRSTLAGLSRVHPHQLRHTAASAWLSEGSESDAMALFGWKSSEMPKVYGRAAAVQRAHAAARRLSLGDRL